MLTDPKEIEIISRARQKNVRDHRRSREHFTRIFADFLADVPMQGQRLVDMGPGQYDFGVLARERGAGTVGLDHDEATQVLDQSSIAAAKLEALRAKSAQPDDSDFDTLPPPATPTRRPVRGLSQITCSRWDLTLSR